MSTVVIYQTDPNNQLRWTVSLPMATGFRTEKYTGKIMDALRAGLELNHLVAQSTGAWSLASEMKSAAGGDELEVHLPVEVTSIDMDTIELYYSIGWLANVDNPIDEIKSLIIEHWYSDELPPSLNFEDWPNGQKPPVTELEVEASLPEQVMAEVEETIGKLMDFDPVQNQIDKHQSSSVYIKALWFMFGATLMSIIGIVTIGIGFSPILGLVTILLALLVVWSTAWTTITRSRHKN